MVLPTGSVASMLDERAAEIETDLTAQRQAEVEAVDVMLTKAKASIAGARPAYQPARPPRDPPRAGAIWHGITAAPLCSHALTRAALARCWVQ